MLDSYKMIFIDVGGSPARQKKSKGIILLYWNLRILVADWAR